MSKNDASSDSRFVVLDTGQCRASQFGRREFAFQPAARLTFRARSADREEGSSPVRSASREMAGVWPGNGSGRPAAHLPVSKCRLIAVTERSGAPASAISSKDGRYELSFGPGISYVDRSGTPTQAATITADKPGYFEENLNRQGNCVLPHEASASQRRSDQVLGKPKGPRVLAGPAAGDQLRDAAGRARVAGRLVDEHGQPLVRYSVALSGADLPPSSSVMCSTETDKHGRFSLDDIPTTFRFSIRGSQGRSQTSLGRFVGEPQPCVISRSPVRENFEPGSEIARYDFGTLSCAWRVRQCMGEPRRQLPANLACSI